MEIPHCEIEIKRHALIRAMQRGITPDVIEATIKGGKVIKFRKNYFKFTKKYKQGTVICVGELSCMKIKIITVMVR